MRLTKDSYRTHKIEHTDEFQCSSCMSGFSSQTSLEHHQTNPQNCIRIKRIRETKRKVSLLKSTTQLEESLKEKVLEEISNENRNKTFGYTDGNDEEDADDNDVNVFNCEVCDKYFVSQESLENHKSQCSK